MELIDINLINEYEKKGNWKIMRMRDDKDDPNALHVTKRVKDSIDDPVEE